MLQVPNPNWNRNPANQISASFVSNQITDPNHTTQYTTDPSETRSCGIYLVALTGGEVVDAACMQFGSENRSRYNKNFTTFVPPDSFSNFLVALNASEKRFWFTRLITALLKTPYLVQEPHPYFQPLGPHAACDPCLGRGGDAANLASWLPWILSYRNVETDEPWWPLSSLQ